MTWTLDIDHIAGIIDGEATVEPGLNAVRAANWQGKSSFIEAVKTALGTSTELTEGADHGQVHLETPERTLTVDLVREGASVTREGTPYLTDEYDAVRADLFACLDGDNDIRRTVRRGENLEDVLLRPLDFQNIDARIAERKRERERLEDERSQAKEAAKRVPGVQEKVTRLEGELADLRERRASLGDTDATSESDSSHQQLSQARSERAQARQRVDQLEQSVERTESRLSEAREKLTSLSVPDDDDIDERLEEARAELAERKRDAEVLQSLYSATEMVLDENRLDLVTDVERDIDGDTVTCWTCGAEASREDVERRLDSLGSKLTERRAAAEQHRDEVEELEAKREQHRQTRQRMNDLQETVAELEETLADRRQSLADARDRLDAAAGRVDDLSATVDEAMAERSDVESEIKYREAELDDATAELAELESRADRVDDLDAQLETVRTELEELRTRKDRIEREAREAFDAAMTDIVSRFETGFEAARLTADFDIVVARDGREASLGALSEGELELIGFVAALAGRQSFDVADVPLMLVDDVGGLDDQNLHTLIDYLRTESEYLVFTAYPEYGEFDGQEIDPTAWTVANEGSVEAD